MSKHILKIRKVDERVFEAIKNGQKPVETRAATEKYRKIKTGDILVFACDGQKLEKEVARVKIYKDINEILSEIDFKKIMPFVDSKEEVEGVYYSFPDYEEKIKKHGLIAFWLK